MNTIPHSGSCPKRKEECFTSYPLEWSRWTTFQKNVLGYKIHKIYKGNQLYVKISSIFSLKTGSQKDFGTRVTKLDSFSWLWIRIPMSLSLVFYGIWVIIVWLLSCTLTGGKEKKRQEEFAQCPLSNFVAKYKSEALFGNWKRLIRVPEIYHSRGEPILIFLMKVSSQKYPQCCLYPL